MKNTTIAKFCVLTAGILSLPAASYAGKEMKETKEVIEKCKESCITGDLGVNIVSQYISRGAIYENQGAIIQPYQDLYFKLYEGEGFLNKITLNLGTWYSFNSNKTDAGVYSGTHTTTITTFKTDDGHLPTEIHEKHGGVSTQRASSTRGWYEMDFTAGVSFTFLKNFTFTPSYFTYMSPNDGFATFQGLNFKLAYDDTDLLGAFALHPYVQVLFGLENTASAGTGTGSDDGVYYEVGIAPSLPLGPVTVTFPVTAGFGSNGFYGSVHQDTHRGTTVDEDGHKIDTVETTTTLSNETFGFISAGVNLSYPLKFIPECYGAWTVNASYTYYYLGDGTADYNTEPRGGTVRDYSENEHVFSGGVSLAF